MKKARTMQGREKCVNVSGRDLRKDNIWEGVTPDGKDTLKQLLNQQEGSVFTDALRSKYRPVVALVGKRLHQRQETADCLSKY
jgi:hypothetical protein